MMSAVRVLRLLGPVALLGAAQAAAQQAPTHLLDPRSYTSASGEYVVHVDPGEHHGAGPADYRLTKVGDEVWAHALSFTLRDVLVQDDGTLFGYAYTEGLSSFEGGDLVVAIVSPIGDVFLEEKHPRAPHRMHSPDWPIADGLVQLEGKGLVRVRVPTETDEQWWVYDLLEAARSGTLAPHTTLDGVAGSRWLLFVRPVEGTPLLLLHWGIWPDRGEYGPRFLLATSDLDVVWSDALPGDYADLPNLVNLRDGTGLPPAADGHFSVLRFRDQEVVTYSVTENADARTGWGVEEVARAPFDPSPPPSGRPVLPIEPVELEELGSIQLNTAPPEDVPRRFLSGWHVVDGDGHIEAVWRESEERPFVWQLLAPDGETLREVAVDASQMREGATRWARAADGHWIVALDPWDRDGSPRLWTFDPSDGSLTEAGDFRGPPPEAIAAIPGGGFVTIGSRASGGDVVTAYGPDGSLAWSERVFAPEDVAVTESGSVVVLDNIRKELITFSADGGSRRTIDLEVVLGHELNYPSGIEPALDGGVLLYDFGGEPDLWIVDAAAGTFRSLLLRHADERAPTEFPRWARYGPQGKLWSSDGYNFQRFDGEGVVDRVVGTPADELRIHEPMDTVVDAAGRVLVFDGRNAVVHVFDAQGEPLHRCLPDPGDFPDIPWFPEIAVDGEGSVFVKKDREWDGSWVAYDASGGRTGLRSFPGLSLVFLPGSLQAWAGHYDEVSRLDAEGAEIARIQRRADRTWLGSSHRIAAAANGSLLVVETKINTYSRDGVPRATYEYPSMRPHGGAFGAAYGDGWIALGFLEGRVLLVREEDGAYFLFRPVADAGKNYLVDVLTSPGGDELWLFRRDELRIVRYAWPE